MPTKKQLEDFIADFESIYSDAVLDFDNRKTNRVEIHITKLRLLLTDFNILMISLSPDPHQGVDIVPEIFQFLYAYGYRIYQMIDLLSSLDRF